MPRASLRALLRRLSTSAAALPSASASASAASAPASADAAPLLDAFSRRHTYLRLSLTERCNLRCRYCMPSSGVALTPPAHLLSSAELTRVAAVFVARGVDKIRLTGGEPLLRPDLPHILAALAALRPAPRLSLTTNGLVLARSLPALRRAGLAAVNISLDTLSEHKFQLIARRKGQPRVLKAIHAAIDEGLDSVKVNVVVMRGVNDDELVDFVRLTRDIPIDVRFIEYMPFDGNRWSKGKFVSYAEMLDTVARAYGALERAGDAPNDTAKHYRVPGFRGRVGFITSMSDHFCGTCNRLRITADGNLKVCLFGQEEVSLRDAIRAGVTDDELSEIIDSALSRKHWMLGGNKDMHVLAKQPNRSMIRIGG